MYCRASARSFGNTPLGMRHLDRIVVGEVEIARIVELEGALYDPPHLLPDATREALAPHAGWLAPRFYQPGTHRLISAMHCFLVQTPHHTVLIDTCLGADKQRGGHANLHMRASSFLDDLAALGVAPPDIDVVLCTHLHVDHVGWNTRLVDGRWVPTFANARYLMNQAELDNARREAAERPHADLGAYADSVAPVLEAGRVEMVDGEHAVDDHLRVELTPGHTPGHVAVRVASRGREAVFSGDVFHHPVQYAEPAWNSSFCILAEQARTTRRAFLDRHAESATIVLPGHFATPTAGRIGRAGDAFRLIDLEA